MKDLQHAGADEALAEAVVNTIGTALGESVATKLDIQEVKAEIKNSELRMTIRLGAMMVAVGGLIIAIMKLF
ncbi:hypothetical protein [Candidatus Spongiihabitans sp.]|uniref:hypothetical protein n=1 Tax=Candidatus Spongiihabitans sp. TaxID=3101308 RepID=UPI003C7D2CF5